MSKIIKELFNGNICPTDGTYAQDSLFVQAARLKQRNYEMLMGKLNVSEKELFDNYCAAEADIEDIRLYDNFSYALKYGILLMAEVFMGNDETAGGEDIHG